MGPRTERVSMPRIIANAHGVARDVPAVYDGSFVTADATQPLPDPSGDAYLSGIALGVSEAGGTTIVLEPHNAIIDHLAAIDVLPHDTKLIKRPAKILEDGKLGYPATSVLHQLQQENYRFDRDGQRPFFTSIYESPEIRSQAEAVGMQLLGRPDSNMTNNKARLREHAAEFGIDMLPGQVFTEWGELEHFADRHKGERSWMKVATGSGGDLVFRVDHTSRETVREGIQTMRGSIAQAFENASFGSTLEDFWPEGAVSPTGFPNIIEEDASVEGEIVANGSNFFVVNHDGTVDYHGTFKQITDPETGEFMGSQAYEPDPEELEKIMDQTMRMAAYAKSMGYKGPVGMDFFVMKDAIGRKRVRPIEGNFRFPISSNLWAASENLKVVHEGEYDRNGIWVNRNQRSRVLFAEGVTIPDLIGTDLAFGVREPKTGKVLRQLIPLATRSIMQQSPDGKVTVMASDKAKWISFARDMEQAKILAKEMKVIFKG